MTLLQITQHKQTVPCARTKNNNPLTEMGKIDAVLELLRTRIWFQHSLVILACVFCYGSSLHGDFVFDDAVAIVRNADVTAPQRTLRSHILHHDFWGQNLSDATSHKSYRPLVTLTFRWEHSAFGLQSAPMKLHNLLLHCAVCSLLLRLLPQLLGPRVDARVSFAAVALFAVHPVHTEAVSGIVGRADVLCSLWFVLALLVWTRRDAARSAGAQAAMLAVLLVLATLALASKEVGVMVLPLCWTVDAVEVVCDRSRGRVGGWWRRLRPLVRWRNWVLAVMTVALVVGRLWMMDFQAPAFRAMDNPVAAAECGQTRILSQLYLYVLNMWLLLCPDWLSFDWALGSVELIDRFTDPRCFAIAGIGVLFGGLVLTRNRNVLLALALLVVPFLPASGIVRVGFVVAERVLYTPSIGFCTLVALGLERMLRGCPASALRQIVRHALLGGFCVVLAVLALRCRWRADEWTDESRLYRSALRVCPSNAKVHYNIAKLLADRGDRPTAVNFYEQAIRLHPGYEVAHTNLGNLYREQNQLDLAERHLLRAIEIKEEFPPAWMNLGIVHAAQGKYDLALLSYRTALRYRPQYATCLYNIGNLYIAQHNETLALQYWTDAVRLDPQLTKAWSNILSAHDNAGRTADVFRLSEVALRLATEANDPAQQATVLFIRANAFGKLGDFAEAERLYRTVIAARPHQNALYYVNLGVLYHRWGGRRHEDEAMWAYRQALALDPELRSASANLAKLERRRQSRAVQMRDDGDGRVTSGEVQLDLDDGGDI